MSEHPAAKRHRAYAQAVDEAFAQRGYLDGHKDGYANGVQAAREAVESHFHAGCDSCDAAFVFGPHALAAIDALTDGGCRTPDDPCADPDACDSLTCARERLHLTLRDEADALAAIDALRGES